MVFGLSYIYNNKFGFSIQNSENKHLVKELIQQDWAFKKIFEQKNLTIFIQTQSYKYG